MACSHPEFNEATSALDVAATFGNRIKGKNVVITGVSPNGIGQGTAAAFASQQPANLILLSRTKSKLESVADELREKYPAVNIKTVILDLGSQESIRAAAGEVASTVTKVDYLINNAGLVIHTRQWMAASEWSLEKVELQFGANHIGPFLLTNLLLPLLLEAAKTAAPGETRIVTLSSAGHRLSPIRFHDWNFEGKEVPPEEEHVKGLSAAFARTLPDGYIPIIAYSQSKTANILFTVELRKYLTQKGIAAYTLHPGGVRTDLGREHDDEVAAAMEKTSKFWKNTDQGASTTMVAALDPGLDSMPGLYLDNCQFKEAYHHATDPVVAEKLWHLSERLVGQQFDITA